MISCSGFLSLTIFLSLAAFAITIHSAPTFPTSVTNHFLNTSSHKNSQLKKRGLSTDATVSLAVGVPSFIIAVCAAYFTWRSHREYMKAKLLEQRKKAKRKMALRRLWRPWEWWGNEES